MKIVIFDFEVFRNDCLLGAYVLDTSLKPRVFQTWDFDEMREFYQANINSIWVGHNNEGYDNHILQGVVNRFSQDGIKRLSDMVIKEKRKPRLNIQLYYYDLMKGDSYSLKSTEAYMGKNISETQVDFNLRRALTDEEKLMTESYNRDDLQQTFENFKEKLSDFALRLDVINEFDLPLSCISITGTQLAEKVLHAKKIDGIEYHIQMPKVYPNLKIEHKEVLDFFLNREYAEGKTLDIELCGTLHKLASGGIHAAKKKYHCKEALYFDVSGYYNLIMINFDLLPRSIPDEYKALYKHMYEQQLILKKTDPAKRGVYKTICLSVFGAMNNKYCAFYDPYRGDLVRLSGEMFLVDLLEKLEGKVDVVQSNTDGVIAELKNGVKKADVIAIIDEWQERTGFVLKVDTIYDIWQRDVNCYCYRDDKGGIHTVGEAVNQYENWQRMFKKNAHKSKEPVIMDIAIVDFLMNGISPEDTIERYKHDNLRLFQFIAKKQSYDYCEYSEMDLETGKQCCMMVQGVNRAFPLKSEKKQGMLYKVKRTADGGLSRSKILCLPDSVFVYNEDILQPTDEMLSMIDFDYYVNRIYEKLGTFIGDDA